MTTTQGLAPTTRRTEIVCNYRATGEPVITERGVSIRPEQVTVWLTTETDPSAVVGPHRTIRVTVRGPARHEQLLGAGRMMERLEWSLTRRDRAALKAIPSFILDEMRRVPEIQMVLDEWTWESL